MSASDQSPQLYIIIPVLNEKNNIPVLIENLTAWKRSCGEVITIQIIFVDDGSHDGTYEILIHYSHSGDVPVTVLKHPVNIGPGGAFATAFLYLHEKMKAHDLIATMEGDNTSNLKILDKMLTRIKEGYDTVLASPYQYGGGILGVSSHRIFLSHMANFLAKMVLGLRGFQTLSSFFRLYRAATIQKLQQQFGPRILDYHGFECMVELLQKLVIIQASISEVEMLLDWTQRKGKSKMKIFKAIRGYISLLISGFQWKKMANTYWKPFNHSL